MKHIGDGLAKHKEMLSSDEKERSSIITTIKGITGILLTSSEFKSQNTTLRIITTPLKRQKILMYQKAILDSLTTKRKYTRIY